MNYNKLEEILGDLNFGESVEGVVHPETVYEKLISSSNEDEIVEIIEGEVFNLTYSKSYRSLKFEFGSGGYGMEIDRHTMRSLNVVNDSLKEINEILNQIVDDNKAA